MTFRFRRALQISAFTLGAGILFSGCTKPQTIYPIEPHIEYKSHNLYYDEDNDPWVDVTFTYTDGDGDLGVSDNENDTNMHINYLEEVNGAFRKVTATYTGTDTIDLSGRMNAVLVPNGKEKAIKGEIVFSIFLARGDDIGGRNDRSNTAKLELWISDRAGHKSNKIETPEFILK